MMDCQDLAKPGDQFPWYLQVCTWCWKRAMVYARRFGPEPEGYNTTVCVICQKQRRGQARPHWWVSKVEDLPKEGEPLADWEARKKANPGVFT